MENILLKLFESVGPIIGTLVLTVGACVYIGQLFIKHVLAKDLVNTKFREHVLELYRQSVDDMKTLSSELLDRKKELSEIRNELYTIRAVLATLALDLEDLKRDNPSLKNRLDATIKQLFKIADIEND